jgi:hypothetical protein
MWDQFQVINPNGYTFIVDHLTYLFPYSTLFNAKRIQNFVISIQGFTGEFVVTDSDVLETEAAEDLGYYLQNKLPVNVYSDIDCQNYIYTLPSNMKIPVHSRCIHHSKYVYQLSNELYASDNDHEYYYNQLLAIIKHNSNEINSNKNKVMTQLIIKIVIV